MPDGTSQAIRTSTGFMGIASGTHVLTENGECRVEQLAPGDQLVDVDGRSVTLMATETLACRGTGESAPVRIAVGALGNHRELVVAPDQLVALNGALLAARALVDGVAADVAYTGMVTYRRLVTARDAIIVVERAAVACLGQQISGLTLPSAARAAVVTPA